MSTVRVRIAPSPTGAPHVGTAYIALFNLAFARKNGGAFVLRIEDTDRARSTPESEAAILRALRWLGLAWDEGPDVGGPHGPYRQSERSAIYREHADRLLASGAAYRCFCTPERLDAMRKAQKGGRTGYDGACRDLPADESRARATAGEPHVVRLRMPREGTTVVRDRLRGEVAYDNAGIDDQVLLKSDGFPTYHLANVVDDRLMGITHVIRAEEWLVSTPKHVRLYDAFGWTPPEFCHMPLLRNADKSKISKRKNPVSLDFYRDAGFLPEALLNYLALMGWSLPGAPEREKFSLAEMIDAFDLGRVSLGGPVFDLEKLSWLNGLYLRELSDEALIARLRGWRLSDEFLRSLVPLARERMRRLDEFVPLCEPFLRGEVDLAPVAAELAPKGRAAAEIASALDAVSEALDELRAFVPAEIEARCRAVVEARGWKAKELFTPLRVAVTGRTAAPPLFETMAAIGRELVRFRLRKATEFLKSRPA